MAQTSSKRKRAARGTTPQLSSEGEPAPARPTHRHSQPPTQPATCRVEGCLEPLKPGYHKYRICVTHGSAPELTIDGKACRWCQQCGRFHALNVFWGTQRSCRDSLLRHQERRLRRLGQLSCGPGEQPAPLAASPSASLAPASESTGPASPASATAAGSRQQPPCSATATAASKQQCPEQQQQASSMLVAVAMVPDRPAKRHKQQQASSEVPVRLSMNAAPSLLPATSCSVQSSCAAVSLLPSRPAQQQPPRVPAARPLTAAQAAAFAAQQGELWDPMAPLTPAGRVDGPAASPQPRAAAAAAAATPTPAQALSAATATAAVTPMRVSDCRQLAPPALEELWPPVRLAAPGPAAAAPRPQQAPQCSWPLSTAARHPATQPMARQPSAHATQQLQPQRGPAGGRQQVAAPEWEWLALQRLEMHELPGRQHGQLPMLREASCGPPQRQPEQPVLPQPPPQPFLQSNQAELTWQPYCGGVSLGGRSASPCLPHFAGHEVQALVEILNPPSLDPPNPADVAEALACAADTWAPFPSSSAGAAPRTAAAAPARADMASCHGTWSVHASQGLCCSGGAHGSSALRPAVPACSPSPPDGWAGSAAAWQQLWEEAVREGEQRAALAFAAMQLPAPQPSLPGAPQAAAHVCGQSSAGQAAAEGQPLLWEWPEDLFPMHCPPSPVVSWMS